MGRFGKMAKKCLITQDLIEKVEWCKNAPHSIIKEEKGGDGVMTWDVKAYNELVSRLNREPTEFPEAAKRGVEFEKRLYAQVDRGVTTKGSKHFQALCELLSQGYFFQKSQKSSLDVEGNDVLLYGKMDAVNFQEPRIIDIKTTEKFSRGKYLESVQHELYCYMTGIPFFTYAVVEWEEYPKIKKLEMVDIDYRKEQLAVGGELEQKIKFKISEVFAYLKHHDLWEVYRTKYCLY